MSKIYGAKLLLNNIQKEHGGVGGVLFCGTDCSYVKAT